MEKDLREKIKKLRRIEPSKDWLSLARRNLITHIEFYGENKRKGFFWGWIENLQSVALAVCLLIVFLGGPWLAVKASEASLPGELLYSVKRISEGVKTMASSKNHRVQLQVEFANRRLEELNKITRSYPFSKIDKEKDEKVKEAVGGLKNNLANAGEYLEAISKEEIVSVAEEMKQIKEEINKAREKALESENDLNEAEKAVEEIDRQILTVLKAQDGEKENISTGTSTEEEILIFLEELEDGAITTTEELINQEDDKEKAD